MCAIKDRPPKPPLEMACDICASNNFEDTYAFGKWVAVAKAPQECPENETGSFQFKGRTYVMVKVCVGHLQEWWDGDYDVSPDERPPNQPLP